MFYVIYRRFIDAALRDIDRFKRQKVKDLKEIFTNYAIMQIKQCKKVKFIYYKGITFNIRKIMFKLP